MIARFHRFHGHASLGFVYKRGDVIRGGQLSLKYIRNDRRNTYRLAVVVSRKVDKSAVVRNRIRRRIYEVVRLLSDRIDGPYDLVFTVFSSGLAELPAAELSRLVQSQLEKAGVLSVNGASHGIVIPKETE